MEKRKGKQAGLEDVDASDSPFQHFLGRGPSDGIGT